VALGGSDLGSRTLCQLSYSRSGGKPSYSRLREGRGRARLGGGLPVAKKSEGGLPLGLPEMARRRTPAAARPSSARQCPVRPYPFEPLGVRLRWWLPLRGPAALLAARPARPGGLADSAICASDPPGRSVRPHDPANSVSPESSRPFVRFDRQNRALGVPRRVQDL